MLRCSDTVRAAWKAHHAWYDYWAVMPGPTKQIQCDVSGGPLSRVEIIMATRCTRVSSRHTARRCRCAQGHGGVCPRSGSGAICRMLPSSGPVRDKAPPVRDRAPTRSRQGPHPFETRPHPVRQGPGRTDAACPPAIDPLPQGRLPQDRPFDATPPSQTVCHHAATCQSRPVTWRRLNRSPR